MKNTAKKPQTSQTFLLKVFDADTCNVVVKRFKDWREAGKHIQNLYDAGWTVEAFCGQDEPDQSAAPKRHQTAGRLGIVRCRRFRHWRLK